MPKKKDDAGRRSVVGHDEVGKEPASNRQSGRGRKGQKEKGWWCLPG